MVLDVAPHNRSTGLEFVDETTGGVIPKEFIGPIEKGIIRAMEQGILSGYPVTDIKVTLVDGKAHEVDSSDMAFRTAGFMAFKEACRKCDSILLEPIMGR